MERRRYLTALLAFPLAGCVGGNGDDENREPSLTLLWNYQVYDELDSPGGGTFHADDGSIPVGVELEVTNHTDEELSLLEGPMNHPYFQLHIDGELEPMHAQSQTEDFESVSAGESATASLIYLLESVESLSVAIPGDVPESDRPPETDIQRDDTLEVGLNGVERD